MPANKKVANDSLVIADANVLKKMFLMKDIFAFVYQSYKTFAEMYNIMLTT